MSVRFFLVANKAINVALLNLQHELRGEIRSCILCYERSPSYRKKRSLCVLEIVRKTKLLRE